MGYESMFEKDEHRVIPTVANRRRGWLFAFIFTVVLCLLLFILRPNDEDMGIVDEKSSSEKVTNQDGANSNSQTFTEEQERIYNDALSAMSSQDYIKARQLSEMLLRHMDAGTKEWVVATTILTRANLNIMFNKVKFEKNKVYTVKSGDSFSSLSDRLNTTMDALWKLNSLPEGSSNLWIGNKLNYYDGDWRIEISKSNKALSLYDGDSLFAVFPVGISSSNKIPAGEYTLPGSKKKKYPTGGERNSTYGTRFMGFNSIAGGIHGTWAAGDVQGGFSEGYVRLSNSDIESLYMIAPGGTKVKIID